VYYAYNMESNKLKSLCNPEYAYNMESNKLQSLCNPKYCFCWHCIYWGSYERGM